MKKYICELPSDLFEIFLVELNGYGVEILSRDERNTVFAIYSQNEESQTIKETILSIFEDLGSGKIVLEEDIQEENWEEKWKENFKPILVEPFIIIPEWEIYEGKDLIPIKLKIAMAFGTGLHPSTQLMLSLIPKYVSKNDKVIDIGCGTGILSIAAAKLGAIVDAVDIEKKAVEECKINSWENQVKVNCFQGSVEDVKDVYDVVLSNLQIDIFDKYFSQIKDKFKKVWLLSGIFKDEKDKIVKMADENGLEIIEIITKPEQGKPDDLWYGFAIKHK
ncbi:MAG TPA: methyltransferase domain-containing protein [Sulfurihydrogenibium azorense]|uniref:Ribosomal protein L11 methyltransferase n=1 Tax=Sulfurihydrogenibium azorense TaxID=309806 RepID=A0A832DRZ3_9AQUI|nr:MAG: 50S ribosomal protein L11 methyltransferase [Sulfurihydrogenibium sp.]HEV09411.1 methyltransferase domain-containing protein [Sulfurihydrogenibium azorense]